jgi:hypothetical protein
MKTPDFRDCQSRLLIKVKKWAKTVYITEAVVEKETHSSKSLSAASSLD